MTPSVRTLLRLLPIALTCLALAAALNANPFARAFVDRTTDDLAAALDRATLRTVRAGAIPARLEQALVDGDTDRIALLLDLAGTHDAVLPPDLRQRAEAAVIPEGWTETALDCGACMVDIASCERLSHIAACAIPFELTPAGDVNALRRAGMAAAQGEPVDEVDAALAVVGLGATAAVAISGGSSATVKAGATGLRLARRAGALTPTFAATLADAGRIGLRADRILPFLRGEAALDTVLDTARLARLQRLSGDLATVARHTSLADTLVLLRQVETAEDAARLARVANAAGPATRGHFELLGRSRVFRLAVRLSDLAATTLILAYAAALQLLILAAQLTGTRLLKAVLPR
ncbi:hypothetical protein AADZ90_005615 [Aestuariibius sp. 2305UL40-4]|uniref:hypothetical protein n=1 Tax=Aestuariibius violaceus TaxID=3234132 RepID=UPI00345E0B3D